jgi:hypothetical protein
MSGLLGFVGGMLLPSKAMALIGSDFDCYPGWSDEALREEGVCMTCRGDGIVRYGSVWMDVYPDCGGTGDIDSKVESNQLDSGGKEDG